MAPYGEFRAEPGSVCFRHTLPPSSDVLAWALLGTALGDALGREHEGAGPTSSWDGGRRRLAASLAAPDLRWTDDTQESLALAAHLVAHPDVEPAGLAAALERRHDPHRGMAQA